MLEAGYVVIACGGGGIPVIENEAGELEGVEAVIDKDLASSLLATRIEADSLLITTVVERVAINFNTPEQEWLQRITADEARRYQREGQFAEGSMGPKIEAILRYLDEVGGAGIITDPPHIMGALEGRLGTTIMPG
jgi:carbamate kinase